MYRLVHVANRLSACTCMYICLYMYLYYVCGGERERERASKRERGERKSVSVDCGVGTVDFTCIRALRVPCVRSRMDIDQNLRLRTTTELTATPSRTIPWKSVKLTCQNFLYTLSHAKYGSSNASEIDSIMTPTTFCNSAVCAHVSVPHCLVSCNLQFLKKDVQTLTVTVYA